MTKINFCFCSFQITKIQAANSEYSDQQRERGHGNYGHRAAARPVPAVQRRLQRRGADARSSGARAGALARARRAARPVGRQAVRGGVRHVQLY